jgi:hypothetical protein
MNVLVYTGDSLDPVLAGRLIAALAESGHECEIISFADYAPNSLDMIDDFALPEVDHKHFIVSGCLFNESSVPLPRLADTVDMDVKAFFSRYYMHNSILSDARAQQELFRPPKGARMRI